MADKEYNISLFDEEDIAKLIAEGISPKQADELYNEDRVALEIILSDKCDVVEDALFRPNEDFDEEPDDEELFKPSYDFDKGMPDFDDEEFLNSEASFSNHPYFGIDMMPDEEEEIRWQAPRYPPEYEERFDERFNRVLLGYFYVLDLDPMTANSFDERFDHEDVYDFMVNDCDPIIINQYPAELQPYHILMLHSIGIQPSEIPKNSSALDSLLEFMSQFDMEIFQEEMRLYYDKQSEFEAYLHEYFSEEEIRNKEYLYGDQDMPEPIKPSRDLVSLVGYGCESFVLLDRNGKFYYRYMDPDSCWNPENCDHHAELARQSVFNPDIRYGNRENYIYKIGKDVSKEAELLLKIAEANKGNLENVVKIKHPENPESQGLQEWLGFQLLNLEYIKGHSLNEEMNKKGKLPHDQVLRYGRQILNGLTELRNADVHHRDIHPGNIIIDEYLDRAIIIDLGHSTSGDDALEGNKLFGGNNDLISLGQLMYKMATGDNLFNEGPYFSFYSDTKRQIKTARETAYENPDLLRYYLNKACDTVGGDLGRLVSDLLYDDLWTQPSKERVEETKERFNS